MVHTGEALLLDIRPASEFESGHLPLARSIPFDELEARLSELPRDKIIVIYRRSPFCIGTIKRDFGRSGCVKG